MKYTSKGILKKRVEHMDAGLDYLIAHAKFGQPMTAQEIADVCGVTAQAIAKREATALRKLKSEQPIVLAELLEAAASL